MAAWLDVALDAKMAIPAPTALETLRARPEFAGWTFAVVTVDPTLLDDSVERVNITLPRRVLRRLDAQAKATGMTRSGWIAQLSLGR